MHFRGEVFLGSDSSKTTKSIRVQRRLGRRNISLLTRIHTADAREQHRHGSGKAGRSRLVATRGTLTTGLLELAALRPDVRLDVRVRHTCRERVREGR